jgi:hypothetical protein
MEKAGIVAKNAHAIVAGDEIFIQTVFILDLPFNLPI